MNFKKYIFGFCILFHFLNASAQRCNLNTTLDCGLITAQGGIAGGTNIIFCDSSVVPVVNTSTGVVDSTYFCWDDGKDTAVAGTSGASHFYALKVSDPCSKTFNIRMTVIHVCTNPNGSVAKSIHYIITPIVIKKRPKGSFGVAGDVCVGTATALTNTSACFPTAWKWIFGDGTVDSTNYNASHSWTQPGNYNVKLVSVGCGGLTDTVSKTVVVHGLPAAGAVTASVGGGNANGCSPLTTTFTNASQYGDTYKWSIVSGPTGWSFNSGSSSTSASPTMTFTTTDSSIYRLRLTTTSQFCGAAIWDTLIKVRARPVVKLLNIPDGCNSLTVRPGQMVSYTGGEPLSYDWTFTNMVPSTSSIRYPPDLTYTASNLGNKITVITTGVCGSDTAAITFRVTPSPTGTFTSVISPPNNCVPSTVQLQTTTTNVTAYDWQVISSGNFTYQGGTNRNSANPILELTNAGSYQIRGTLKGCSDIVKDTTITLIEPPAVLLDSIPNACLPYTVNPGAIVHYSAGTPVSYQWDYTGGNRNSDNTRNPAPITFDSPGQYGISAAATNICGTGRDTISFRVDSLPEVAATLLPDNVVYCLPAIVTLNNELKYVYKHQWRVTGSGRWRFLNGATAISPNPAIEFLDEGNYTIQLEGTGCITDSWTRTIRVKAAPVVALDPIANACQSQSVDLTNLVHYSGGTPTAYRWDFKGRNPDSISTVPHPPILNYNPGQYSVIVRTTNECGVSSDTSKFVVTPAPVIGAVAVYGKPNGCVPLNIDLQSNTQNAQTYQWSVLNGTSGIDYTFEAGTNVNTQNANLRFPNAGSYQVRLNVIGCRSGQWDTTFVLQTEPIVRLATIPTQCAPQTVVPSALVSYTGGLPTHYSWTYAGANRNTDTVRAPNALIFNRIGLDSITVSASNVCGVATEKIDFILKGGAQPIIAISASDTNLCSPVQLTLRSDSSIAVTAYRWTAVGATFLNGTNANSPNPVLRYDGAGTYRIGLQADGCSTATWDKTVNVLIPPVVHLATVPDTCGQLTVDPAALIQYNGGNPTLYSWTFTNLPNPTSNLRLPQPVNYTQSGTYSIINRAENKCGVSADTIQFTIRPPAPIAITPISLVCNTDTTIQLQVNPVGGIWSGASITQAGLFNPRTAPLGINTLRYDYGAGQCFNTNTTNVDVSGVVIQTGSDTFVCQNAPPIFLRGQTPAHGIWSGLGIVDSINGLFNPRLVSVGMHEVTYTIKNGQNRCVNQKNRRVLVYPAPTAAFDSLPIQCVGVPVQFKNRSIGIDSALWTFGDGQTTPLLTPSHPYTAQGLYPVTLYVRTLNSCVDSFHRIVDVSQPGISAFIPDKHTGCGPLLPVYFTNTSTGRNLTYAWDFGTGRHDSTRNVLDAILFEQRNYDTIYNVRLTTTNSCGVSTVTDTIHLKPRPTARFGIRPHNDCSPMTVEFSNASPGYPTQFYWYFGNGSSSQDSATQVQIFRTDTTERTFKITLVVSNVCGSDTIQQNLTVLPPRVKAFFTIDTLSGCAPFTPRCESFSTVGSTIWWDSGDAGINKDTTGGQRFSHTYNREGFYTITLFAANPNGCGYDSLRRTIQVLPPAQITIGHDTISCKGDTLNLRAVSSNFFFRVWYFGDGDSSRIFNARHIYQAPGTYPITMYGNTLNGNCPVKRTSLVTIRELPKADLVVDRIDGCPPLTVNFGNRSTQAGGVGIPPYSAWDFGDKNTTNISSPTHVFDTSGNFSIRLRVTDNFGCSDDTIWSQVIVHPVPDARFTIQPTKACGLPMLVRFQNQTLGAVAYNWQLGNGLTSTATHPTTSYGTEGVVPVRLIATNSFFCKDTFYESVHPTRQPTADFTLSPQSGCEPLQVHFQDRSTNATGRRFWRFGDGSTDTLLNPNHVYVNHGIYTPKLIVSNGTCYDSLQLNNTVTVLQTPIADFEPRDSLLPRPTGVILFNNQSKFAQSYVWDFGDGSGQVSQTNPTHRYNQARLHQVTLFATAANGCKDTIQKPVNPQFFSGLYVPNVFSPASGSEGIRHFLPKGSMLKTYYAAVYSAYGDLIWESDKLIQGSPVEGWDGTRNGTPLPQDVYVWKIQATFEDGTIWVGMTDVNGKHSTVGTLTLLR